MNMSESAKFEAFLDALQDEAASSASWRAAFLNPLATTTPFLWSLDPQSVYAQSADDAFAEAAARAEPRENKPKSAAQRTLPRDDIEAIRRELQLATISTRAELQRARRRFMWANHPDRRADLPRDLATRRVATANMLIDRALRDLDRARRTLRPS
jgi:hypothetical protein